MFTLLGVLWFHHVYQRVSSLSFMDLDDLVFLGNEIKPCVFCLNLTIYIHNILKHQCKLSTQITTCTKRHSHLSNYLVMQPKNVWSWKLYIQVYDFSLLNANLMTFNTSFPYEAHNYHKKRWDLQQFTLCHSWYVWCLDTMK